MRNIFSKEHLSYYLPIDDMLKIIFGMCDFFLKIPYDDNNLNVKIYRHLIFRYMSTLKVIDHSRSSGFTMPAWSLIRDLIEIEYSLIFFKKYPDEVNTWYTATRQTRMRKYSQYEIRNKIADKNRTKTILDNNYCGHSDMINHITPKSLILQNPHNDTYENDQIAFLADLIKHIHDQSRIIADICLEIDPTFDITQEIKKIKILYGRFLLIKPICGSYFSNRFNTMRSPIDNPTD